MIPKPLKRPLLLAHRWLALALSPVLLLIVLSGAILAVKPIVASEHAAAPTDRVPTATLVAALGAIDPAGRASAVGLAGDGRWIALTAEDPSLSGIYAIATRTPVPDPGLDLFAVARDLHKHLLIGAGLLVEIATYVLVALLVAGLLFGLPHLRNNLRGWHRGLGWLGFPLIALTPVTGLLMTLHVGMPELPAIVPGEPIALSRAIAAVSAADAGEITRARRFRDGSALVKTASPEGERFHVVESDGRVVLTGEAGWVKALHEGTWAGPWSGALNLVSAVALIALVGTGLVSWWRGLRRSSRPGRADQDLARLVRGAAPAARPETGSAARVVGRVRA